jgi:hypothetical protein
MDLINIDVFHHGELSKDSLKYYVQTFLDGAIFLAILTILTLIGIFGYSIVDDIWGRVERKFRNKKKIK